ncbi:MAG TPA: HD domain-containing phosphohydrolase [Dehalococcoidia bacterium]|nr:HD domain-containing phosphohydrolase [Dehalococcoidia bacterium]
MPIFSSNSPTDRGSIHFARRRVRRREAFGLFLWVAAVLVALATAYLPLPAHLGVLAIGLLASGIIFLKLGRANLADTEEAFDTSYARILRAQEDLLIRVSIQSESRDGLSSEHLHRVRENATLIAYEMGFDIEDARAIGKAAVVHDIGKAGIADSILGKSGKLTREDYEEIKKHTFIGEKMLGQSPLFELERQVARHHHEWWDGTGYPDGITDTNIPLAARITAVVDVFDSLVTTRPYKEAWSLDESLTYLQQKAGLQFDPDVVQTFVRLVHQGKVRGWETAGLERGKAFPASSENVRPVATPTLHGGSEVVIGGRRMRVVATSDDYEDPLESVRGTDRTGVR